MTTLDGVERELDAETVLVCDENGPSGIAGIMGGQASEVGGEGGAFDVVAELVEAEVEDVLGGVEDLLFVQAAAEGADDFAHQAEDAGAGEAHVLAVLHADAGALQDEAEEGAT